MFISYGNYTITFTISSSPTNDAAFLTDRTAMNNGRSGDGASIQWCSGAQTTSTFVQISCSITSALDPAAAAIGAFGLVNVQGLPIGTKVQFNGGPIQRLVDAGPQAGATTPELCAWTLPFAFGNSTNFKIFNDVNGVASIPASTVFAIGEVSIGRLLYVPGLVNAAAPQRGLFDPTAVAQTGGGGEWPTFRKTRSQVRQKLGLFKRADVYSDTLSSILSGATGSGKIAIKRLQRILAEQQTMAVCDVPCIDPRTATTLNGYKYNPDDMQFAWMLARASNLDSLVQDASPFYSWSPVFSESR